MTSNPKSRPRSRWRWLLVPTFLYLGILVLLAVFERSLVYPAPPTNDGAWKAELFNAEEVHFESIDGTKLHGWYWDHPQPRAHVLFCHGNGEHVGYLGHGMQVLCQRLQISVFAIDYRGYGKSDGTPFEQGLLQDGEAAQKWLADRAGIKPQDVVLYGRSLGGGVAVHLASAVGTRALIAERTFHSMVEIGAEHYPWLPVRMLMRNRFPSAQRIASYTGPLLQLHGTADRVVPLSSGRTLYDACPSKDKRFLEIPGMGHNDPAPEEFYAAFSDLLDSPHAADDWEQAAEAD